MRASSYPGSSVVGGWTQNLFQLIARFPDLIARDSMNSKANYCSTFSFIEITLPEISSLNICSDNDSNAALVIWSTPQMKQ